MTHFYEIRLEGHLDDRWQDWFDGISITLEEDGTTLLSGPVTDQPALYGILRRMRDLGLPLVSVNRVEESKPNLKPKGNLMSITQYAAIGFAVIASGAAAFQVALAAGAPWGAYAMGGAYPGTFPPALRVAALFQAVLLVGFALVALSRADLILPAWAQASRWMMWVIVAFSTLSLILNLITPSAGERAIWAPVAFLMLSCSLIVALSNTLPNPAS
ncbi:MAG: hypothetical protein QY332_02010 [Anaerolineales bacterium]|nr:MAG: hypothetical protein QY332_02010 [Anaerolineales bacterium]